MTLVSDLGRKFEVLVVCEPFQNILLSLALSLSWEDGDTAWLNSNHEYPFSLLPVHQLRVMEAKLTKWNFWELLISKEAPKDLIQCLEELID